MQGKKIYYEVVQTLRNRLVNGSYGVYLKPETRSIFPSIHKGLINESMLAQKKPISMNGKIAIIKSCLFFKYQANELYFVIEPVNFECTNDKVTFIITAQLPKKGQHSELFPVQLEELGDCVAKDFLNGFLREISRK